MATPAGFARRWLHSFSPFLLEKKQKKIEKEREKRQKTNKISNISTVSSSLPGRRVRILHVLFPRLLKAKLGGERKSHETIH